MCKRSVSGVAGLSLGMVLVAIASAFLVTSSRVAAQAATPAAVNKHKALEMLDLSPAVFIENKGQWDGAIRYGFDGKGTRVSFTDAGPVFQMLTASSEKGRPSSAVFSARFVGSHRVTPVGIDASTGRTNYYVGNDSSKWRTDVPSYGKIAYRGIYDGVDLYAWGRRSGLKYEFHVAPGASWRQIVVRYDGIEGLAIDEKGALHIATCPGEMVDNAPVVYQETPEGRVSVDARFRLVDSSSYGFEITGRVDASLPLVIDPVIAWASYLGGSGDEPGGGMWMDSAGNIGVGAGTMSSDFPTTSGVMQRTAGGGADLIMAKFSGTGTLLWATYFGGDGNDEPYGVVMDSSNNVWLSGVTDSSDFPVTGGAFQSSAAGGVEAFIARISSSGTLAYASFYGGSGDDTPTSLVCDGSNNCWMIGTTDSPDFPVTASPFQNELAGGTDVFVVKFSSTGSRLFASYLGGGLDDAASDEPNGTGIDSTGDIWVTGKTESSDFPVTLNAFETSLDSTDDGFVCKISHTGALAFATYAGRQMGDKNVVLVDSTGNAYSIGMAGSESLATTPGAFQPEAGGWGDAFIRKITPQGAVAWASYYGGSGSDWVQSVTIDSSGSIWLAGSTSSDNLPATAGTTQPNLAGGQEGFVARITPQGGLAWSTYIGGSGDEKIKNISTDVFGNAWVGGATLSTNFPATPNAFQTASGGGLDAFVAKISRSGARQWATYIGGAGTDGGDSFDGGDVPVVGDSSGNAWVATEVNGSTLTTTPGAFQTVAPGGWDMYVAKISAPEITTAGLPSGTVNVSYSRTLEARAGTLPYAWSLHAGSLPAGLSLNASTGVVSGTPTATGAASFTIRVTDDAGAWENKPLTISVVTALTITTTSFPGGTVGAAYSQSIGVTGGMPPYSGSISSGGLPAGLSVNGLTGAISGTPTASGTSSFTVRVVDSASSAVTKGYSIVIRAAPSITTSSLASGTVGVAYSRTLAATGGTTPFAWSISNSSLPSGLSLAPATGVISGTPGAAGTSSFTVRLADDVGATATKALSITVYAAPVIATTSLPNGTPATAYSQTLAATGGRNPLTWSLHAGSLPTGLSLNGSTGVIGGTPSATGGWNFTARVADANGASATKALSIAVYAGVGISTSSLPADTVGIAYNQTLAAGGGVEPYTWAIHAGNLPAGLNLDASSGTISGTPSAAGTSSFTMRVTDNVAATGTKALSIVINPAVSVTTTSLPAGVMGGAYNQTLTSTGGTAGVTWSVSDASLPAGLALGASNGKISGTPTAAGTSSFTVTATDAVGATGTAGLSLIINAALAITTSSLSDGTMNQEYDDTLRADGGLAPYTWSIISGSLPAGLALDKATGEISGFPTAFTFSKFTLKVKDSQSTPKTATRALAINVYPADPAVDPNWLEITKFQLGLPATASGHDSFSLSGSFNMWPGGTVPKTVQLAIGDWSITVDASAWKNSGKSRICTARKSGVNCKVAYWVNGTSKCTFQFTGALQSLQGSIADRSHPWVGLRVGDDFEMSAEPTMTVKGSAARLTVPDELPYFFPQKMSVTRNLRLPNRDSFSFTAKVGLDGDFDPLADDFHISFGGLEINLPAGTMPAAVRRVAKYKAAIGSGNLTFQLNNVTHLLSIKVSGADLSMAEQPVVIGVAVSNHGNPEGEFELFMSKNKSGSLLKY